MSEPVKKSAAFSFYISPGEEAMAQAIQRDLFLTFSTDPKDIAERERWRREREQRLKDRLAMAEGRHAAVAEGITGRLLDVLNLHGPRVSVGQIVCMGCDMDGYEAEWPEWPCRTWNLAAGIK